MDPAEPGKATLRFSEPYEEADGLFWVSFLVVRMDPEGSTIRWIDDGDGHVVLELMAGETGKLPQEDVERLLVSIHKAADA
jgi:hypothetical protein